MSKIPSQAPGPNTQGQSDREEQARKKALVEAQRAMDVQATIIEKEKQKYNAPENVNQRAANAAGVYVSEGDLKQQRLTEQRIKQTEQRYQELESRYKEVYAKPEDTEARKRLEESTSAIRDAPTIGSSRLDEGFGRRESIQAVKVQAKEIPQQAPTISTRGYEILATAQANKSQELTGPTKPAPLQYDQDSGILAEKFTNSITTKAGESASKTDVDESKVYVQTAQGLVNKSTGELRNPPKKENVTSFQFGVGSLKAENPEIETLTTKNLKEYLFSENKNADFFQITQDNEKPRLDSSNEVKKIGGAYVLTSLITPDLSKDNSSSFQFGEGLLGTQEPKSKEYKADKSNVTIVSKDSAYREVLKLFSEGKPFSIQPLTKESVNADDNTLAKFNLVPPEQKRKNTPIEDLILGVQESRKRFKDNPILGMSAGGLEGGLGLVTSTVNLMRSADEFLEKTTKGTSTKATLLNVPRSPSEYPIGLVSGAISSGDIVSSESKARSNLLKLVEEEGLYPTVGKAFSEVAPFGKEPFKIIPIRSPTFKFLTEEGKVATVRTIDVGYGSKTKDFLTITNNKIYPGGALKNLGKSKLGELESVDRGLEFTTTGKLGTKILTSEQGLSILEQAGKALPRDVKAVGITKELTDLIKLSSQKVSNKVRQKTDVIPETPLSSLQSGAESQALVEEIIPSMKPIKGTLAETVQLDEDLLKPTLLSDEELAKIAEETKALALAKEANIIGAIQSGAKPENNFLHEISQVKKLRNETTGDLDVEYSNRFFGVTQATTQANKSVDILNKIAGQGRTFYREGTNVLVKEGSLKPETVINLVTKKDAKTGYLNKQDLNIFGVKIKGKPIEVAVKEGSNKVGKFVPIEKQAEHRIESSLALQGPKSDKYKGLGKIPYLKEGAEIQTTEKGYTILPTEHRFKDLSKLLSQDTEQISRNLIKSGFTKEGERVKELTEEYKSLYPEIDFGIKAEKTVVEESASSPSLISSIGKQSVKPSVALGLTTVKAIAPKEKTKSAIKQIEYKSATKPMEYKSIISPLKGKTKSPLSMASKSPTKSVTNIDSLIGSSGLSSSKSEPSLVNSLVGRVSNGSPSKKSPSKSPSVSIDSLIGSVGGSPSESPSKGSTGGSPGSPGISPGSPGSTGSFGSSGRSPSKSASNSALSLIGQKKVIGLIPNLKGRLDKTKPDKPKPLADFLGNTSVASIVGLYKNRGDITYGRKLTAKLYNKSIKSESKNLLGSGGFGLTKSKKNSMFKEKKSKKKRFSF